MPIANYKPTESNQVAELPKIEPEGYRSIVNDDNYSPLLSLLSYVSGAPWTVNYYSQAITKHNDVRELDAGQPNIYQQYQLINSLELRVSNALASSYDAETGITSITGTSLIYPFMIPNNNDYFITEAGDGNKGIFRITNVERKTFNRDSVYEIDYTMVGYIDALGPLYTDLNDKVIRTYYFSKERLLNGLQPILKEIESNQITSLNVLYKDIVSYYFRTFFNKKYMTIVLPGQEYSIYDTFLIDYLFKLVDSFDAEEIRMLKTIPTDGDIFIDQDQLFSLLERKDYSSLSMCNRVMGIVDKKLFSNNSSLHGLRYSNIDYIIYPDTPDTSVLINEDPDAKMLLIDYTTIATTGYKGVIADLSEDVFLIANVSHPLIHPVNSNNNYILSDAFYDDTSDKSILEILVKDYLQNNSLNLDMVIAVSNRFKVWNRLDQFYYGPIILTLIKEANRGTYS